MAHADHYPTTTHGSGLVTAAHGAELVTHETSNSEPGVHHETNLHGATGLHGETGANLTHHGNVSHHGGEEHCGAPVCTHGILLPLWKPPATEIPTGDRVGRFFLYFFVQIYLFIGMSLAVERFIEAIEVIVSKKRKVKVISETTGEISYVNVPVWNKTVAHMTLFVIGGCAPEIILVVVETITAGFEMGELGPSTIVGSGCYNLFIITAISIASVKLPAKKILELPVFFTTAAWAIFAYLWMYIITILNSRGVIEIWEAVVTFAFFPVVVFTAYLADKEYFGLFKPCCPHHKPAHHDTVEDAKEVLERREKRFAEILAEMRAKHPNKTSKEVEELAELALLKEMPKDSNYYRIQTSRQMAGEGDIINLDKLHALFMQKPKGDPNLQTIVFDPPTYTVMEDAGKVRINVVRQGQNLDNKVTVDYATSDGNGRDGVDYHKTSGQLEFQANESLKHIFVEIIDDDVYNADKIFYLTLSDPKIVAKGGKGKIELGLDKVATVTKLDDDHGGEFHFSSKGIKIEENCGEAVIKVERSSGTRGTVVVPVNIKQIDAIPGVHFEDPKIDNIKFEDRESEQSISIKIFDEGKIESKAVKFTIELGKPSWTSEQKRENFEAGKLAPPQLRDPNVTTVTITENKSLLKILSDIGEADVAMLIITTSWREQFISALRVESSSTSHDDEAPTKTWKDYVKHILTVFWKVIFAFIPPTALLDGWMALFVAGCCIGVLVALIRDVASAIGCTVGLAAELTAITFISFGTTLPDLYASRMAAIHEESADAAIGHVSGAIACNVFVGLGLATTIASIKRGVDGEQLTIPVESFSYCIILFFSLAIFATIVLILRRLPPVRGELGGPPIAKYLTVILFACLWLAYVVLVGIEDYCHINVHLQ